MTRWTYFNTFTERLLMCVPIFFYIYIYVYVYTQSSPRTMANTSNEQSCIFPLVVWWFSNRCSPLKEAHGAVK